MPCPVQITIVCLLLVVAGCNSTEKTIVTEDHAVQPQATQKMVTPGVVAPSLKTQQATTLQDIQLSNYEFGLDFLQRNPQRISEFVRRIFQDKRGHLWFGANGDAVIRYDGESLKYFSFQEWVRWCCGAGHCRRWRWQHLVWSLYKGKSGNNRFPIENFGMYRYDGKSFANFHKADGLASHAIQSIYEDKEGRLWLGGWLGLFRFDGNSFSSVTKDGPWQ